MARQDKIGTWAAAALWAFTPAGCTDNSPPVIDAQTTQALQSSLAKAKNALPDAQRAEFETAYQRVVMKHLASGSGGNIFAALAALADERRMLEAVRATVAGKTAAEIIGIFRQIEADEAREKAEAEAKERAEKAERDAKERAETIERASRKLAEAKAALEEAQKKHDALEEEDQKAKRFTSQLAVSNPRVKFDPRSPDLKPSSFQFTLKNETGVTIASYDFKAVVTSEGRSVPWYDGKFKNDIAGGLEPGEEKTFDLSPMGVMPTIPKDRGEVHLSITIAAIRGPVIKSVQPVADFARNIAQDRLKRAFEDGRKAEDDLAKASR